MAFAYVLKSLKNGRYYYGSTGDLAARLRAHNQGKVRSTRAHAPYVVQYFERYESRSDARKRELYFKTISGYNWLKKNGKLLA